AAGRAPPPPARGRAAAPRRRPPARGPPPAPAPPTDADAVGGRSVIGEAFPAEMPAHFLVYFAVADCDETVAAALRLGGRVTEDPFDTPYGRIALLTDDQGAAFAVLAEPKAA
ncbi:VOC family protein, partial [Streptomyces sp. Act-28]